MNFKCFDWGIYEFFEVFFFQNNAKILNWKTTRKILFEDTIASMYHSRKITEIKDKAGSSRGLILCRFAPNQDSILRFHAV